MNPDDKSRLLIGSLAAAVIIVVGYGLYQTLGTSEAPSLPPPAATGSTEAAVPTAPEPGSPTLSIQAETTAVANTPGHEASTKGDPDLQYEWSIKGGTIEGDVHGSAITWTAGTGNEVVLSCQGTNAAGKSTTAMLRVVLGQPPVIKRFEASPTIVTEGSSAMLSWGATNAQKLTLDPGGQDVSASGGPSLEVKPTEDTTYKLTATNGTGVSVTRELVVKVVPAPGITAFHAEPANGSPTTFAVTGEFKGGKAELRNGITLIASAEASPLRAQVTNIKEGITLTLKVTNEAGAYASNTLTFGAKTK